MTISQAVISGIVQGITEFFPISSSGHLVILHHFFGVKENTLAFDIFLHFGTLISIILFFWKDIVSMLGKGRAMLKFIVVGCVPTFIIGILFKDMVESIFTSVRIVGISLVITGVFLFLASFIAISRKMLHKTGQQNIFNSMLIGIAQGIAVVPGISRSGATIGTALIAGLDEVTAIRYSFLLALPAVLGANLLKARDICGNLVSVDAVTFLAGGIAAAVTGLIAIKVLFAVLKKNLFFIFSIYCVMAGFLVIALAR